MLYHVLNLLTSWGGEIVYLESDVIKKWIRNSNKNQITDGKKQSTMTLFLEDQAPENGLAILCISSDDATVLSTIATGRSYSSLDRQRWAWLRSNRVKLLTRQPVNKLQAGESRYNYYNCWKITLMCSICQHLVYFYFNRHRYDFQYVHIDAFKVMMMLV